MTLTLCGCGLPERSFVSGVCVVLLLCGEEGGVFGDLVFYLFFYLVFCLVNIFWVLLYFLYFDSFFVSFFSVKLLITEKTLLLQRRTLTWRQTHLIKDKSD